MSKGNLKKKINEELAELKLLLFLHLGLERITTKSFFLILKNQTYSHKAAVIPITDSVNCVFKNLYAALKSYMFLFIYINYKLIIKILNIKHFR